jgi:hypothetical protein
VYKFKRWQWILIGAAFLLYCTFIIFQVFGSFYIGYPPYTQAWLNHTRRPIERSFGLTRASSLHIFGALSEGRIKFILDGKTVTEFVGDYDKRLTLPPGPHRFRLEMDEATGSFDYRLE